MELLAVRTARLIATFNGEELNPTGRSLAHDFMRAFVERYQFIKYPQTADDIVDSASKGITFELGKLGEVAITKLVLHEWGVIIDTARSTDASENILQDILEWASTTFQLSNRPDLVTQKIFISELVVKSELNIGSLNTHLQGMADNIKDLLVGYGFDPPPFEPVSVALAIDPTLSKQAYSAFRIERLAEAPFKLGKYYSGAPLKTSDHIALLEAFEDKLR